MMIGMERDNWSEGAECGRHRGKRGKEGDLCHFYQGPICPRRTLGLTPPASDDRSIYSLAVLQRSRRYAGCFLFLVGAV